MSNSLLSLVVVFLLPFSTGTQACHYSNWKKKTVCGDDAVKDESAVTIHRGATTRFRSTQRDQPMTTEYPTDCRIDDSLRLITCKNPVCVKQWVEVIEVQEKNSNEGYQTTNDTSAFSAQTNPSSDRSEITNSSPHSAIETTNASSLSKNSSACCPTRHFENHHPRALLGQSIYDPWIGVSPRLVEDDFPSLRLKYKLPKPSPSSSCALFTRKCPTIK